MPAGENLKALWADKKWRANRLKRLHENKGWIEARSVGLDEGRRKAIERRQAASKRKNYDLVRQNAIMLYEYERMKAAYVSMKAEVERTRDEIEDVRQTFGLKGDLCWVYCEQFGLTPQQAKFLSALMARDFLTKDQMDVAARRNVTGRAEGKGIKLADVLVCRLRRVLSGHGIEIKTIWGEGVMMTPENKAKVRALTIGPHLDFAKTQA